MEGILEKLTPADLRCLIQLLDTKFRAGDFQLIFPAAKSEETAKYLKYFRCPRYYNLLNFAYLDKYGGNSQSGEPSNLIPSKILYDLWLAINSLDFFHYSH